MPRRKKTDEVKEPKIKKARVSAKDKKTAQQVLEEFLRREIDDPKNVFQIAYLDSQIQNLELQIDLTMRRYGDAKRPLVANLSKLKKEREEILAKYDEAIKELGDKMAGIDKACDVETQKYRNDMDSFVQKHQQLRAEIESKHGINLAEWCYNDDTGKFTKPPTRIEVEDANSGKDGGTTTAAKSEQQDVPIAEA